ncbi:L-carnitine CoA-transferase [Pseudodesulfovibrio tunisiensis]|uniref:L-carnitine CoA-transferase n=1 Tax=Pseudodesulfovibrio tunisiensis TaxID=463192 RepID=UPI001FB2B905|nr:L-carnitine CoA-transferase [Pseudodesulfovibrio tunisiensis]
MKNNVKEFFDNSNHRPPQFGVLQGVKVVFSAVEVAGPLGPHFMAEWGADVIWLENVHGGDTNRSYRPSEHEHRNDRSMSLDIFSEEGKEVFKKLIKEAEVFLVAGKGPNFIKKGITDEFLWEINPKLVITRISGYGQEDADPNFIDRPCYDGIAQAMSGYMSQNGTPESPMPAYPYVGDLFTALFSLSSTLAALIRARETGKGESIDIAMTEVLMRLSTYNMVDYLNDGRMYPRPGAKDPIQGATGIYKTKDGFLFTNILGRKQMKTLFSMIGCEDIYGTGDFKEGFSFINMNWDKADYVESKVEEYFKTKTNDEHIAIFDGMKVAAAPVLSFPEVVKHPQYQARDCWVDWETMTTKEKYKGVNVVPRFKVNQPKIWRSMPHVGYDNDAILEDLGYSAEQIDQLYGKGVIYRDDKEK